MLPDFALATVTRILSGRRQTGAVPGNLAALRAPTEGENTGADVDQAASLLAEWSGLAGLPGRSTRGIDTDLQAAAANAVASSCLMKPNPAPLVAPEPETVRKAVN